MRTSTELNKFDIDLIRIVFIRQQLIRRFINESVTTSLMQHQRARLFKIEFNIYSEYIEFLKSKYISSK